MAVQGEEPYEEDLDWLKYGRQMIQESPKILGEAAKTFLTLASAIQHYRQALKVRTEKDFPVDWAATENNLGLAYNHRIRCDRADVESIMLGI